MLHLASFCAKEQSRARYGWAIKETGEPGKGAKFVMTIPKQTRMEKKAM